MIYSSMYRTSATGIIYQGVNKPDNIVRFEDMKNYYEDGRGKCRSIVLEKLAQRPEATLQNQYHLAAIIEKFFPEGWNWIEHMYYQEKLHYEKVAGEKAYLMAKGQFRRPEFFDDWSVYEYDRRIDCWAQEQGLYRSQEELLDQTKKKVDELI